jgi:hypothetical protein
MEETRWRTNLDRYPRLPRLRDSGTSHKAFRFNTPPNQVNSTIKLQLLPLHPQVVTLEFSNTEWHIRRHISLTTSKDVVLHRQPPSSSLAVEWE